MTGFSRAVRATACLGIHMDSDVSPVCAPAPFPFGFGALRHVWHGFEQCLDAATYGLDGVYILCNCSAPIPVLADELVCLSIRRVAEEDTGGVRR